MQTEPASKPRHIALVEDDVELCDLTTAMLREEGYEVTALPDAGALDRFLVQSTPDILLLDVMLPGEDGLSICRRLAPHASYRIIMLTARGTEIDRIIGLELGADDYLPKPFNPRELLARIRAQLRRLAPYPAPARLVMDFLGWRLDLAARALIDRQSGADAGLSSGEFDLLAHFVQAQGRVLSRDQLLDATRGRQSGPFDRAIDVQISKLRRKLGEDSEAPQIIKTVRGGGYIFVAAVRRSQI
jgi:two-component system, OmpR family, response regulator